MKVVEWVVAMCLISMSSGCSSSRYFANSNMFAWESLDLKRNGTFLYSSGSDEIGNECIAQGAWRNHKIDGVKYVALEINRYTNAMPENCEQIGFKQHGLWLVTHGGIVRVSGSLIKGKGSSH